MIDIQKNIVLAPYTTFKIGGPAKEFVVIENENELAEALQYAKDKYLKYYILAGGSNMLFADEGFDGLIIQIKNQGEINLVESEKIECWAGINLAQVINFARENSLSGLENLAGIPGSIGGAVRGNAGAFGTEIKNLVEKVRFSDENGMLSEYSKADCDFEYRSSAFKQDRKLIILSVVLKLEVANKDAIAKKMKEVIQKRNAKQPTGWVGCAGSFFENPIVRDSNLLEKFEKETKSVARDGKIPAGWLISELGLRGKKIGYIEVSEKHANFIINTGKGTAQDVVMLISFIKQQVRDNLGIQLKEEVNYIGY